MHKKLTITIDERVYESLHSVVGRGKISQFIEDLVRPQVLSAELDDAYRRMAADETRESEALDWAEATGWWSGAETRIGSHRQNFASPV